MGLGGYDYDEFTDSLASRPAEFDMQDSAYNVLTLMNSMDDTPGDFALVIEGQEGESELESDSKCLLVQCLKRRFPRYQQRDCIYLTIRARDIGQPLIHELNIQGIRLCVVRPSHTTVRQR